MAEIVLKKKKVVSRVAGEGGLAAAEAAVLSYLTKRLAAPLSQHFRKKV